MRRKGSTLYHVCFGDDCHYYFGSIAAIYDHFSVEEIGVTKQHLWNYGIKHDRPYRNKKCTIYRGIMHRKKGNRYGRRNSR